MAGSGVLGGDSGSSTPAQPEVDWIEFRSPPFAIGQTESFRLHLTHHADELTWHTTTLGYVDHVRSDQGETTYDECYVEYCDDFQEAWCSDAGLDLQCVPLWGPEVVIECQIQRGDAESTVSMTLVPFSAPMRSGPGRDYGIAGVSGEEHLWQPASTGSTEVRWDFGGGAFPDIAQEEGAVSTILGPPGRYSGSYTVRNEWGFSGPQQVDYWVQPRLTTHPLNLAANSTPSMLLFNDRIRLLIPTEDGYLYGEALEPEPASAADWRFSPLPLPATHTPFMRLGEFAGRMVVFGGLGESEDSEVVLYWRASTPAPLVPDDWDVGGIPESAGAEVVDLEIEPDRVGLLLRQDNNLMLLWDDTPILSQWRVAEVAHKPYQSRFDTNRLLLSAAGPVVVSLNLLPGEPAGLMYRSATWDAPDEWSAHQVLGVLPGEEVVSGHLACISQGRPLILAHLNVWSSALLRSTVPRPLSTSHWERLETCEAVSSYYSPFHSIIDVRGDRVVMESVTVRHGGQTSGGLLLTGDPSDLTSWTPFLPPDGPGYESISATLLTADGVGVLTRDEDGLSFGMITP